MWRSHTRFEFALKSMQESTEPAVDDTLLSWIARGKRSKALLVLYRTNEGSLADAWYMMDGLSDDTRFDSPDQDFAYLRVEQYLQGKDPWKEKAIFYGIALLVVAVGLGLSAFAWPRFKTGWDSYSWPKQAATILNVRHHEETSYEQDRQVTREYLSYEYEFEVDAQSYKTTVVKRPFYPSFGDEVYELGESIEIVYNPKDPDESIHKRFMYQRSLFVVVGGIIALIGLGFLSLFVFMDWSYYSLRNVDRRFAH